MSSEIHHMSIVSVSDSYERVQSDVRLQVCHNVSLNHTTSGLFVSTLTKDNPALHNPALKKSAITRLRVGVLTYVTQRGS